MRTRLFRIIRFLPVVAAIACGSGTSTPLGVTGYTLQQAADSIPLPYRTDVRVGNVWMNLTDVLADSRCPQGVACVWAGDAAVSIVVHPGCYKDGCAAPSASITLHTTLEPRIDSALGYRVQLLSLKPEPVVDTPVDSSQYVAWVKVTP